MNWPQRSCSTLPHRCRHPTAPISLLDNPHMGMEKSKPRLPRQTMDALNDTVTEIVSSASAKLQRNAPAYWESKGFSYTSKPPMLHKGKAVLLQPTLGKVSTETFAGHVAKLNNFTLPANGDKLVEELLKIADNSFPKATKTPVAAPATTAARAAGSGRFTFHKDFAKKLDGIEDMGYDSGSTYGSRGFPVSIGPDGAIESLNASGTGVAATNWKRALAARVVASQLPEVAGDAAKALRSPDFMAACQNTPECTDEHIRLYQLMANVSPRSPETRLLEGEVEQLVRPVPKSVTALAGAGRAVTDDDDLLGARRRRRRIIFV